VCSLNPTAATTCIATTGGSKSALLLVEISAKDNCDCDPRGFDSVLVPRTQKTGMTHVAFYGLYTGYKPDRPRGVTEHSDMECRGNLFFLNETKLLMSHFCFFKPHFYH
jgi:hypothetical protein